MLSAWVGCSASSGKVDIGKRSWKAQRTRHNSLLVIQKQAKTKERW